MFFFAFLLTATCFELRGQHSLEGSNDCTIDEVYRKESNAVADWGGSCMNLDECKTMCADRDDCSHFNWWPLGGGCRLHLGGGTFEVESEDDYVTIAGSPSCSGDVVGPTDESCNAGCTDPDATNYDASASMDDSSCCYMECDSVATDTKCRNSLQGTFDPSEDYNTVEECAIAALENSACWNEDDTTIFMNAGADKATSSTWWSNGAWQSTSRDYDSFVCECSTDSCDSTRSTQYLSEDRDIYKCVLTCPVSL